MPSEKFNTLKDGYDKAVEAYLKEQRVDTIDALPNKERQAQLNVVNNLIESFSSKNDSDANKLLVFLDVLKDTINVTPIFGHSEFKTQLIALVKDNMPEDAVEKSELYDNFRKSLKDSPEQPKAWFKDCEVMGKAFIRKFIEVRSYVSAEADSVLSKSLVEKLNSAKVSNHSMMSGGEAKSSDDTKDHSKAPQL